MLINRTKILDYLLVYLLIAFSGVPFFYRSRIEVLIVAMLLPAAVFVYRKRKIDKFILYYLLVALLVQLGQVLKFYHLPVTTFIGLYVRIVFAYLCIKAIGVRTIKYYVDILVFSILLSSVFYLLSYLPFFEQFLLERLAPMFEHPFLKASNYSVTDNIIVYSINTKGEGLVWLKRNSGPFWEPGAFAGFIIIAMIFNIVKTKRLGGKVNAVLLLGLISTFSTTGFIAVAYLYGAYYLISQSLLKKMIVLPLLLILFAYSFLSIDFLSKKVMRKLSFTDQTYNTRFKSAQSDLFDFVSSPIVGLGRSQKTRFNEETNKRKIHRNNGVTNFLAMYGVFVFIFYFTLILWTFRALCNYYNFNIRFAPFALGAIFLIGFSEIYFTKVFFIALTMLPLIYSSRFINHQYKELES